VRPLSAVTALLGIAYAISHLAWSASPPAFVRTESLFEPVWIGAIPAMLAVTGFLLLQAQRDKVRSVAVGRDLRWLHRLSGILPAAGGRVLLSS
jgi:hypothetical protein